MNKIIFSKYSNERAKRFALRTDIIQTEEGRKVRKMALFPEGEEHIRHIKHCENALTECYHDSRITLNRCEYDEQGAWLEYLTGETLEEQLDEMVLDGQQERVCEFLMDYLDEVKKGFQNTSFEMTEAFREVFGEVELPANLLSGNIVDIDMVLNNVMAVNGWTLIDYEWTFDFPIPFDFVAYRILYYYLHGSSTRNTLLSYDLIRKIGITEEMEQIYSSMEKHFQEIYVQRDSKRDELHVPIRVLYDEMTPGIIKIKDLGLGLEEAQQMRSVQLYYAADYGFSEEDSTVVPSAKLTEIDRMRSHFACEYHIDPQKKCIRLDPAAQCCLVSNLSVCSDGKKLSIAVTNGQLQAPDKILFTNEDPWMIFQRENSNESVKIRFEIQYLTVREALAEAELHMEQLQQRCIELQTQLSAREEKIRQMENTKVWKAYKKLKRD
ncbi:MAG: hypothetical protein Q4B47_04765 [Eubacteriales bacterium]|nr:hypothetical protein [Eubacteriales bacterium]